MNNVVDLRIAKFHANVSSVIQNESITKNGKLTIQEGRTLELICSAAGQPRPEIYWFKDGRLLIPQKSIRNLIITSNGDTSILHIKNVTPWDTGSYACRAENINGHIKKWMQLNVVKEKKETKSSNEKFSPQKYKTNNDKRRMNVCDANTCDTGLCIFNNDKTTCNCASMKNIKTHNFFNRVVNISSEKSLARNCNDIGCYTFNDQLFTIFETILVCLVAVLFMGIVCFVCRNKRKTCCRRTKEENSKTTQVNLISMTKVRDFGLDITQDLVEFSNEKWLRSPLDRVSAWGYRDLTPFTLGNENDQDLYPNINYTYPSIKLNNFNGKNINLNNKTFFRSNWADLIYEESYLGETEPLNQVKEIYTNSYRGTMSSDTGYGNSFILTPDNGNVTEGQLLMPDKVWSPQIPLCNMSHL